LAIGFETKGYKLEYAGAEAYALVMGEKRMKLLQRSIQGILVAGIASRMAFAQMAPAPHYRPPNPDAALVRVDGRSRGPDDAMVTLTVLSPEHVGLTTKEQPSLYWYQSKAVKTDFELTIMEARAVSPVLELKLNSPQSDGIQRLWLGDHGVKLKEGSEYRWTVEMVIDPANPSRNVVASGVIKRVPPPAALAKRLQGAPPSELPFIYADEGIWYDSLEALSDLIDKQPADKALHEERGMFFMQAKLPEAARFEMKMAGEEVSSRLK
jgi:hypothetical protein